MLPVFQPTHSRLCGQAIVASVLEVPLSEAIRLIGHRRGTKGPELRKALEVSGYRFGPVQLTRYEDLPEYAICRLSRKCGGNWHWLLKWGSVMHDPSGELKPGLPWPESFEGTKLQKRGWQLTSFFEILLK